MMTQTQNWAKLAPFYVAGTLSDDERAEFEAALAGDPALARNVAAARAERAETLALNEALPAPSARAADKLFALLDAEPARKPSLWERLDLGARLAEFFTPRTLGWAASAACLLVAVEAGMLAAPKPEVAHYSTASVVVTPMHAGPHALVGFAPDAGAQAIAEMLARTGVQIVEGPRAGGLFRVRLGGPELSEAEAQKKLESLRQETALVRFAEKAM